ncbi:hypothetical protein KKC87_02855, partial [Patescibacteria group bacterium]|nr:hypothetical protein [Patescibacteria group bacterium]
MPDRFPTPPPEGEAPTPGSEEYTDDRTKTIPLSRGVRKTDLSPDDDPPTRTPTGFLFGRSVPQIASVDVSGVSKEELQKELDEIGEMKLSDLIEKLGDKKNMTLNLAAAGELIRRASESEDTKKWMTDRADSLISTLGRLAKKHKEQKGMKKEDKLEWKTIEDEDFQKLFSIWLALRDLNQRVDVRRDVRPQGTPLPSPRSITPPEETFEHESVIQILRFAVTIFEDLRNEFGDDTTMWDPNSSTFKEWKGMTNFLLKKIRDAEKKLETSTLEDLELPSAIEIDEYLLDIEPYLTKLPGMQKQLREMEKVRIILKKINIKEGVSLATETERKITEEITVKPEEKVELTREEDFVPEPTNLPEKKHPTPFEKPNKIDIIRKTMQKSWEKLAKMRGDLDGKTVGGLFGSKLFGKKIKFVGILPPDFNAGSPLEGLELSTDVANAVDAGKYNNTEMGIKLEEYSQALAIYSLRLADPENISGDEGATSLSEGEEDALEEKFYREGDGLAVSVLKEQLNAELYVIGVDIDDLKAKGKNAAKLEMRKAEIMEKLEKLEEAQEIGKAKTKGPGLLAMLRERKNNITEAWNKTTADISRENIKRDLRVAKEEARAKATEYKRPLKKAAAIAVATAGLIGAVHGIEVRKHQDEDGPTSGTGIETTPEEGITFEPLVTGRVEIPSAQGKVTKKPTTPEIKTPAPAIESKPEAIYQHTVNPEKEMGTGLFF